MYAEEDPQHPVLHHHKDHLERVIPYFLFSDEGRGYRKSPVMIWAAEAVLGIATKAKYEEMKTKGLLAKCGELFCLLDSQQHTAKFSSLKSRFLLAILPHQWYRNKRKHVYYNTFDAIAKRCANLFWSGACIGGVQYYGAMIGIKGDSPALIKLGRLNRAFNRIAGGATKGMCHLCLGGFGATGWEDMSDQADWIGTIGAKRPWAESRESEWMQIPHSPVFPEDYFRNDPFHVCKIGIIRHFGASAIVVMASWNVWPGESKAVLQSLDRAYCDFDYCCRMELCQVPHVKAFTRDILHFVNHEAFPVAGWKGSDSILVLKWLVRVLRRGATDGSCARPGINLVDMTENPRNKCLQAILDASCAMVHFFQLLNHNGLWLDRTTAETICADIEMFTAAYSFLASSMMAMKLCRFHVEPSLHLYRHMAIRLRRLLERGCLRLLSPGAFLCENSEDFIGKVARTSRRCSARQTCNRTLQRYLIQVYFDWLSLGADS